MLAGDVVVVAHRPRNPPFTLAVYPQAVKHREKLTVAQRKAFA